MESVISGSLVQEVGFITSSQLQFVSDLTTCYQITSKCRPLCVELIKGSDPQRLISLGRICSHVAKQSLSKQDTVHFCCVQLHEAQLAAKVCVQVSAGFHFLFSYLEGQSFAWGCTRHETPKSYLPGKRPDGVRSWAGEHR